MMRALVLVAIAACNTGLGTDPNSLPAIPCLPGNVRDANGCFVPVASSIAIDGTTADWADVPAIPVTGVAATELAIASSGDGNADLYVRVGGAPQLGAGDELAIVIAASPARLGTGGFDRVITSASAQRYEKNGIAITTDQPPAHIAFTADGLEAQISGAWLPYQGAARVSIVALRAGNDVAASAPVDACFGWRTGSDALDPHACEVPP